MRRCRHKRLRRAERRRRQPPPMPTTHQFKTRYRSRPPTSKTRRRYHRRPLSGVLRVRKPPEPPPPPVTYCTPTRRERRAIRADALYRHRLELLTSSEFVYSVCYGVDLDRFCSTLDPLAHYHNLRMLSDPTLLTSVSTAASHSRRAKSTVRLGRRLLRLARSCGLTRRAPAPRANVAVASSWSSLLFQRESLPLPKVETRDPTDPLSGLYQQHFSNGVCFLEQSSPDHTPIVIDSGASICLTPFLSDFIGPVVDSPLKHLTGLSTQTPVVGEGTVAWTVFDMFGNVRTIKVTALYVPDAHIRLYSPQQYFQERQAGSLFMNHSRTTLTLADGSSLDFPYSQANLPWMLPSTDSPPTAGLSSTDHLIFEQPNVALMNVAEETNQNLTAPARELLLHHHKLGHADMSRIQNLARRTNPNDASTSILRTKSASVANVPAPMCAACQLGKQKRRPRPGRHIVAPHDAALKKDALQPGARVFLDQYVSSVKGRLPHTKGKESDNDRYSGGLIAVDSASGKVFCRHQVSLRSGETIVSMRDFHRQAQAVGVKFKHFRADNHPFRSKEFRQFVEEALNAEIDFSGVGAQHQNAVVERANQTIMSWARTMMLHAIIHWPLEADVSLWPFAVDHAVYLWNSLPRSGTELAPDEIFSSCKFPSYDHLNSAHVWGCPVYVLDPALQKGASVPKWSKHSRRGQYLGISPEHSSTVARVLHLTTGTVSPQYHVVFDDLFSTVSTADTGPNSIDTSRFDSLSWSRLVASGLERYVEEEFDSAGRPIPLPNLAPEWSPSPSEPPLQSLQPPPPLDSPTSVAEELSRLPFLSDPPDPSPVPSAPEGEVPDSDDFSVLPEPESVEPPAPPPDPDPPPPDPNPVDHSLPVDNPTPSRPRRSTRLRRKNPRFFDGTFEHYTNGTQPKQKIPCGCLNNKYLNAMNWHLSVKHMRNSSVRSLMAKLALDTDPITNEIDWLNPMIFGAKANAEDNPDWNEAMNGPDAAGFWKAMEIEIDTLVNKRKAWTVVDREAHMNVLPSTWAFRIKRLPDGSIRKLKARFCVRGDKQIQDVDFFDTFCPVVHWNTVRLLLILSAILRLSFRQVDYVAAFVQAPIHDDVYVEMPRGFAEPGKVLKLKRNLYGLKQAPRNFYSHLKSKLEAIGLTSCEEVDPCLFVSDRVICLLYVDDQIWLSPKSEYIDEAIAKLRNLDLELEDEDDVSGFLGVHIEHNSKDGTVTLTQKGLIERIVKLLDVGSLPSVRTPAPANTTLPSHEHDGDPCQASYSYPSAIGMLQYLACHTRPDIAFAVGQCARFTHKPRRQHEDALEYIARYLKRTMDKGLILRPDLDRPFDIDCYVDADFAGLFGSEQPHDSSSVKSRTGFVICVANCPVVWRSSLQQSVATSTTEAEYNALSEAMRDVIPMQHLLGVVSSAIGNDQVLQTSFQTTIHEDNAAALRLANLLPGQFTPRTKHYSVKVHWFRSFLSDTCRVVKIDTSEQRADIFTKSLSPDTFEHIRKLLCGW